MARIEIIKHESIYYLLQTLFILLSKATASTNSTPYYRGHDLVSLVVGVVVALNDDG